MKKRILAALAACLLLLSGCQKTPTQESETPIPTPTQDQTAETPPVSPAPETSDDPGHEASFLPDYDPYFDFDQIEVDRTPYEDREGYQDHDVYLLDSAQKLSLLDLLAPDTWVEAAGEELSELDAVYYEAFRFRDNRENLVTLSPWDEDKCLVSCFFTQSHWNDEDILITTETVVRYWAPITVLNNALAFVEDLTPLGTIDYETARYYDLFLADRGFDFVVPGAGGISDDQMAAYMLTILGYEGRMDYELGVPPTEVDAITQKHFGRKIKNYNTAWSKVLPSGNVTATGWDTTSGEYPVLTGTPNIDEHGNITATFQIYSLPEHLWLEEKLPWSVLGHVREYLLTGHGDILLDADEWSDMYCNEITFRIETEEVNGVQKEYVVYDSSRMVD